MDLSTVYGASVEVQHKLRSFKDGKLIVGKDGGLPTTDEIKG
jgi:hypothetical protein